MAREAKFPAISQQAEGTPTPWPQRLLHDRRRAWGSLPGRGRLEHGGSFGAAVDFAAGSAPALAGLFAGWQAFSDVSLYRERPVPFFKRAQLAAADLERGDVADLGGLDRLTAFADNLDPNLTAAIEAGDLLVHGNTAY